MSLSRHAKHIRPWHVLSILLLLTIAAGAAAAWYGYRELQTLSRQVAELRGEFASTTVAIEADIAKTDAVLSAGLDAQKTNVAGVSSQVATLQKLQTLDGQLLAKYSKVYFLNENYMPGSLETIPSSYAYFDDKQMQILPQVLPRIKAMLDAAKGAGNTLYVYSAYRSFDTQAVLKKQYTVTFGAGTAGAFSADQGYSEHQLGTAVDLMTPGLGGTLDESFAKTDAYAWLVGNAHKYGFILSYPPGNAHYVYEPWHWRYVGVTLATYLHNSGKRFYDLDQRYIDTYLASIFD